MSRGSHLNSVYNSKADLFTITRTGDDLSVTSNAKSRQCVVATSKNIYTRALSVPPRLSPPESEI